MSDSDDRRSTFDDAANPERRGSMSDGLTPTTPAEAVEWYLAEREPDCTEKTLQNHRYRLEQFRAFCAEQELKNMNALTGRNIHRYRVWRSKDIKPVTLRGELQTLRVFLEFCASIEAVEQGLRERVQLPTVDPEDEARDEHISADRAKAILDHLERFAYASRDHVILAILWETGMRLSGIRAIDVRDFDEEGRFIHVQNRPEAGTRLKNGDPAERYVSVGSHYCDVISDYISHNRHDVTDDYGRRPLITSSRGRLCDGSVRKTIYRITQPCDTGGCPHDKDPETCEYRRHGNRAGCPSSRSPHGIRRGSITDHLRNGTPQEIVSDRADVSGEVLDQHYDERTEREKMQLRREFLEG